jgi:glycolate oxidase
MNPKNELVNGLKKIVGKENISDNIFECISYGQDALRQDLAIEKIPLAVVKPISAKQVSEVVKYANKKNIPIYVQGKATSFKGAARPKRPNSIILSTENFTLLEIHEEELYFEVGAGVNQYQLEKKLSQAGYLLPLNVGSKFSSTIGGAVAINTIGHMVDICLGKTIDYVMGVEGVLPNGEIIETGTRSIRRPAGFDYTRLFAGAEGLFGIITRIRMRLLPDFNKTYVVGFFPKLTDIGHAFIRLYREKLPPPLYGEFMDKEACKLQFSLKKLGEPKGHMALAITIGHTQEEADRQATELVRVFKAESAIEARIVTSHHEQEGYQEARDTILNMLQVPFEGKKMLYAAGLEAAVPLSHLADVINYLKTGHNFPLLHEAKGFVFGHIGTCDIHGTWLCPADWESSKILKCAREGVRLEAEVNLKWGCASGEVGQIGVRLPFFRQRYGEAAYSALLSIKRALDPNNIINPGNLEGEL